MVKAMRLSGPWAQNNKEFFSSENKFTSIGPIFYEYGSMVITFDSSHFAVIAYEILKNRLFDEKKLLGMV